MLRGAITVENVPIHEATAADTQFTSESLGGAVNLSATDRAAGDEGEATERTEDDDLAVKAMLVSPADDQQQKHLGKSGAHDKTTVKIDNSSLSASSDVKHDDDSKDKSEVKPPATEAKPRQHGYTKSSEQATIAAVLSGDVPVESGTASAAAPSVVLVQPASSRAAKACGDAADRTSGVNDDDGEKIVVHGIEDSVESYQQGTATLLQHPGSMTPTTTASEIPSGAAVSSSSAPSAEDNTTALDIATGTAASSREDNAVTTEEDTILTPQEPRPQPLSGKGTSASAATPVGDANKEPANSSGNSSKSESAVYAWAQHPLFTHLLRTEGVEGLAGTAEPDTAYLPVDFLQLRTRRCRTVTQVLDTLRQCDSILSLLFTQREGIKWVPARVIATVQHVLLDLLPLPTPGTQL